MPGKPSAEQHPPGLNSYWTHVWEHALKVLKAQGSWAWEQKPLLDEYVFALMEAERARVGFGWLDALERYVADSDNDVPGVAWTTLGQIAGSLPSQWDKHTKRAQSLAATLILTPEAQKRHGIGDEDDEPADPFGRLDQEDELARRRSA